MAMPEKYYEVTLFSDFHRSYDSLGYDKKYFKALEKFEYKRLYFISNADGSISEICSGLVFNKEMLDDKVIYLNDQVGIFISDSMIEINVSSFLNGINNIDVNKVNIFFKKLEKLSKTRKRNSFSLNLNKSQRS